MATLTPRHQQMLEEMLEELKTETDPTEIESLTEMIADIRAYALMEQHAYDEKVAALQRLADRMRSGV